MMPIDDYKVLVADPPWKFGDKLPGKGRGAAKHYAVMGTSDIMTMELPKLADDCVLFLWRVSAMQQDALSVVREWGFTPKAEMVWLKRTVTGKRWFGMGRTVRMEHETCIIAVRGRPKVKVRNIRSTFEAFGGRHSQKPEEFFDIVEKLYDGPYCELFARRRRQGWTCLGNEV